MNHSRVCGSGLSPCQKIYRVHARVTGARAGPVSPEEEYRKYLSKGQDLGTWM